MNRFGNYSYCESELEAAWFTEFEYKTYYAGGKGMLIKTGRKRLNIDYLYCPFCGKREVIDDSFAHSWR